MTTVWINDSMIMMFSSFDHIVSPGTFSSLGDGSAKCMGESFHD